MRVEGLEPGFQLAVAILGLRGLEHVSIGRGLAEQVFGLTVAHAHAFGLMAHVPRLVAEHRSCRSAVRTLTEDPGNQGVANRARRSAQRTLQDFTNPGT